MILSTMAAHIVSRLERRIDGGEAADEGEAGTRFGQSRVHAGHVYYNFRELQE